MAHKKAAWSAKNLRDSKPKYRWVKVFWWQKVLAWNIIVRQKWSKYEVGKNTYMWKDFSIHAGIDGIVKFSKANIAKFDGRKYLKTFVNVIPELISEEPLLDKKETSKTATSKKPAVKKEASKKPAVKKEPVKKETPNKSATKTTTKKSVAKTTSK